MTITYKIQNVAADLVHTVMLRKFFQMVFVGKDRKSLSIYTATVLGGQGDDPTSKNVSESSSLPNTWKSELKKLAQFSMKFDFIITGNDNNDVTSIHSVDITEDFLSQIDCIRQVWGEECELLWNNQQKLNQRLEQFTGEKEADSHTSDTALLAQNKVLWIYDEKKKQEPELSSLCIQGQMDCSDYIYNKEQKEQRKKNPREESECAFYRISVPENKGIVDGIELLNWVKTTITFRYKFRESNLNFFIQKVLQDSEKTIYLAPDFTWYFSPPIKTYIDNESSSVEIKLQKEQKCSVLCKNDESNICDCPIRSQGIEHTTMHCPNAINPVANKTTVNFYRWKKDEMISYRQKYRLAVKNILSKTKPFNLLQEIDIFLDMTDEHGRGNRQFVLSIFISFALAFGIDSSRLAAVKNFFPFPNTVEADAWWLLLLVFLSMNLFIRPPQAENMRWHFFWRKINILSCLTWAVCVFIVFKIKPVHHYLTLTVPNICLIMEWIYAALLVSTGIYAVYNIFKYHDPIISSIFDDIDL